MNLKSISITNGWSMNKIQLIEFADMFYVVTSFKDFSKIQCLFFGIWSKIVRTIALWNLILVHYSSGNLKSHGIYWPRHRNQVIDEPIYYLFNVIGTNVSRNRVIFLCLYISTALLLFSVLVDRLHFISKAMYNLPSTGVITLIHL